MQDKPTKRQRRRHAPELKHQVINACQQPGASVAAIALSHGLNANLVHRWLRQVAGGGSKRSDLALQASEPVAFVPVPMPTAAPNKPAPEPIRLELRRGASIVSLQWPASAAVECGAWLREWLR